MRKRIISTILILTMIMILVLPISGTLAGSKNRNGEHGAQGTGKVNGKDGCAPPTESGNRLVNVMSEEERIETNIMLESMPNPDGSHWQIRDINWMGGPCCPSNDLNAEDIPLPNQCCNGPDMGPPGSGVPGNHCLCFALRDYPFPLAADLIEPSP